VQKLISAVAVVAIAFLSACSDGPVAPDAINRDPEFPSFSLSPGQNLRTINGGGDQCDLNTGIAFDGTNLIVSCWYARPQDVNSHRRLDYLDPATGALVKTLEITSSDPLFQPKNLGALAWDASRGKIWVCTGLDATIVALIDPATGVATRMFSVPGCQTGLAFDGADGTIWTSPDQSPVIRHWTTSGTLLGTTNVGSNLGGFGNSGIAVGGAKLFLANGDASQAGGSSQIYEVSKDFSTYSFFSNVSAIPGDLECDEMTFAAQGTSALWVIHTFDRQINAYALPQGACNSGGGSHGPLTSYPSQVYRAHIILCKSANSPPDHYTYTITASGTVGGDVAQNSATLNAGQCRVVFVRSAQSGGNVTLTITENVGPGYVVGSITRQQLGGAAQNFSGPSPTIEVQANSDFGAVVTYNNTHPAG
jgi:hypothetical protein